jgi:hypothetical protein
MELEHLEELLNLHRACGWHYWTSRQTGSEGSRFDNGSLERPSLTSSLSQENGKAERRSIEVLTRDVPLRGMSKCKSTCAKEIQIHSSAFSGNRGEHSGRHIRQ